MKQNPCRNRTSIIDNQLVVQFSRLFCQSLVDDSVSIDLIDCRESCLSHYIITSDRPVESHASVITSLHPYFNTRRYAMAILMIIHQYVAFALYGTR